MKTPFPCLLREGARRGFVLPVSVALVIFAGGLAPVQADDSGDPGFAPGRDALSRLPEVPFQRTAYFDAATLELGGPARMTVDGRTVVGFRFEVPDWIDGPVEWLAWSGAASAGEWHVFDASGQWVARAEGVEVDASTAPQAPGDGLEHFVWMRVAAESLDPGASHAALRVLPDNAAGPSTVAATVASTRGRFELGELNRRFPVRETIRPSDEVVAEILAMRETEGDEAAMERLAHEMDLRARDSRTFRNLYTAAWRSAQTGTGRDDKEWAASVFDTLFTSSVRNRHLIQAAQVMGNLTATLNTSHRHGRLAEVTQWWEEMQRRGGVSVDSRDYADLGPAVGSIPEVRLRDGPTIDGLSQVVLEGAQPRSRPAFTRFTVSAFSNYSSYLARSGRWQEALEWVYWVRDETARRTAGDNPDGEWANLWYGAVREISNRLLFLGFAEDALEVVEDGLQSHLPDIYRGRGKINLAHAKLQVLLELDRHDPGMVPEARRLVEVSADNRFIPAESRQGLRTTLARVLIHHGLEEEGGALLDALVAEGYHGARYHRVSRLLDQQRYDGLEEEILAILRANREAGDKSSEIRTYMLYARYLEATGRWDEALRVRREVVRLCRAFDYFTFLPGQLARLADLLARTGNSEEAERAAAEARALLAAGRISERWAATARDILDNISFSLVDDEEESQDKPTIDLQPVRSVVIPIEGVAWTMLLTLSNPSPHAAAGTLHTAGAWLEFAEGAEESDDIRATWGGLLEEGEEGTSLALRIEAGAYRLISIRGEADAEPAGEFTIYWTPDPEGDVQESRILIEEAETGISGSVLQAGLFVSNPFYSVPLFLHYADTDVERESIPLRVSTTAPARVEMYCALGDPAFVDADGDGSLRDPGDQLFTQGDGEGHALLLLEEGAASFELQIFPEGELPEEGLAVLIEIHEPEGWTVVSENRILP